MKHLTILAQWGSFFSAECQDLCHKKTLLCVRSPLGQRAIGPLDHHPPPSFRPLRPWIPLGSLRLWASPNLDLHALWAIATWAQQPCFLPSTPPSPTPLAPYALGSLRPWASPNLDLFVPRRSPNARSSRPMRDLYVSGAPYVFGADRLLDPPGPGLFS